LDSTFSGMEGYRKSYDLLLTHVYEWVRGVIVYRRSEEENPREFHGASGSERALRQLLDVRDDDILELLVKLRPRWSRTAGQLSVECIGGQASHVQMISNVLLYLWRLKKATETRWMTLGLCSRRLVASWITGIDGLAKNLRGRSNITDKYRLNTSEHFEVNEPRIFVCVGAVASLVPDCILQAILTDDRVPQRIDELTQMLFESLVKVHQIPLYVFFVLGVLCELSSYEMRNEILVAALIAAAYGKVKTLQPARRPPWSLLRGDVASNLRELRSRDAPPEDGDLTTNKIWKLLKDRVIPFSVVLMAVLLLKNCSWATTFVEQLHGSLSLMRKHHKGYARSSLGTRSFLHQLRPLFREGEEDEEIRRIDREIQQLEARRPLRYNRNHHFFERSYRDLLGIRGEEGVSEEERKYLFATASREFARLSQEDQELLRNDARVLAPRRQAHVEDEIETKKRARLEVVAKRDRRLEEQAGLGRMSRVRFGEDQLQLLKNKFKEVQGLSEKACEEARDKQMKAPGLPPRSDIDAIVRYRQTGRTEALREPADWVRIFALNRMRMKNIVILATTETGVHPFYFVYCVKSPYYLVMLPIAFMESLAEGLGQRFVKRLRARKCLRGRKWLLM
jgi:hypothetical protein